MLEKKLITPPVFLTMEDDEEQKVLSPVEEDEEARFLNFQSEEEKEPDVSDKASPTHNF